MLPVLPLGPLSLPVPGLLLILGLALGSWLAERAAPRLGLAAKDVSDILFYSVLAGLVGARVFMILRTPAAFAASPGSVFSLNPALLDPVGGVLTAVAVAAWLAQRRGVPWARLADALVPFFAVLQVALALRAAAQGDLFGLPTTRPWGVALWGAVRHPTQLYWAAGALAVLAVTWRWLARGEAAAWPPGMLFWRFVALSAAWFVFVAGFRGDSPVSAAGWRLDQVTGVLILALALVQWRRLSLARAARAA
ncbi:MAG: prolipoprotein diacylglyceryl transferase [Chloroflexi bacterium]|nr:prolipoprotein diacylglyceryl transferase [Chloroflexota bacterium]